jgi:folate-binding protein YgfZ
MKAALLPDRGVVKVAGDGAQSFLNGLFTADIGQVTPDAARFAALLTPQGKIIVDAIIAQPDPSDGGGFFLDVPRTLAKTCVDRLNFYKLRAKVMVEDLSEMLGVMALWDGERNSEYGLCYRDPRLPGLGLRVILPPHLAAEAADLGAALMPAEEFEAHRIALGVPAVPDFSYGDAFPTRPTWTSHGIDFAKGCYVVQDVVSRMEHRGIARTRIVPVAYDGFAPDAGAVVTASEKPVGTFGSSAQGRALAMLRLDRAAAALAAGHDLVAGAVTLRLVKPDWARFPFPGETKG